MAGTAKNQYAEQGRRLRLLRQAAGYHSGSQFAMKLGWLQSAVSHFERGFRQVPRDKALQIRELIPGFDPLWLWEGDKRGLSLNLLQRIEAEEAKEQEPELSLARG